MKTSRASGRLIAAPLLALAMAGAFFVLAGRSLALSTPVPASPPKALIYAGWYGNTLPSPAFVASNLAFLETQPFDGMVVYLWEPGLTANATTTVMTNTPVSYTTAMGIMAPMATLSFSALTQNLGLVQGSTPPDF